MISGQELFNERERIKERLDASLVRAYENGIDAAEKTRIYRIRLAQKIMRLKADGTPITIIEKLAKGEEEVAKLGTRDDWYREFGRFYDDRCDENVWLNGRWEWRL